MIGEKIGKIVAVEIAKVSKEEGQKITPADVELAC